MFGINNAHVEIYTVSKKVAYIEANMRDQSLDTLQALGRGRMYDSVSTQGLKYMLPGGLLVFLRTD